MLLWICFAFSFLLLQTVQPRAKEVNNDSSAMPAEEVSAPTVRRTPPPMVVVTKDWDISRAYKDVYTMLSEQNACSRFYGGPDKATTVLNGFVSHVKSKRLLREKSFEMAGTPRVIRDPATGASYRLFERTVVNTDGSFYQRRAGPLRRFPSNVGSFPPGTRRARALILLHELGHLIQGDDGAWLVPDDGHSGLQSRANTLRVEWECRRELDGLK